MRSLRKDPFFGRWSNILIPRRPLGGWGGRAGRKVVDDLIIRNTEWGLMTGLLATWWFVCLV